MPALRWPVPFLRERATFQRAWLAWVRPRLTLVAVRPPACRYWCTAPGLGGCDLATCQAIHYDQPGQTPLLFDLWVDPSEAYPLTSANPNATDPIMMDPVTGHSHPNVQGVLSDIAAARAKEIAEFTAGKLIAPPDLPSEKGPNGTSLYAVCCDRAKNCDCDGQPSGGGERPWFANLDF